MAKILKRERLVPNIHVIEVESGEIRRLTDNDSLDETPSWW